MLRFHHAGEATAGRMDSVPLLLNQLLDVVAAPESAEALREYFGVALVPGQLPSYTGGRFEALAGGGDRPGSADEITADDLIAVELLSVRVPPRTALDLLEGPLGRTVAEQLRLIDRDAELGTPAATSLLADGGPADHAWHMLEAQPGVGWVTAGKLMARKRPKLVPVYDGVVHCAMGKPVKAWLWLHERFAEDEGALPRQLIDVGLASAVPSTVHPPRILDVILWMRHHRSHRDHGCQRIEMP